MLFISAVNLVSVLALGSTLTGVVLATGPRSQCIEKYNVPQGGADCTSVAQQAGVNQSTIQSLNPGVNCTGTSPLSAGDSVCTRQFTPNCTLNDTATSQTCNGMASKWNISTSDFVLYNDNVDNNCANLTTGQTYCVSITGCYPGATDGFCQQQ